MDWEENSKGVLSDRLRTLMAFSKRPDQKDWSWRAVAEELADLYGGGMKLYWVMHHLVAAYQEALGEPRFKLGGSDKVLELIMAPIRGHTSVELLGPASLASEYSVEQFYNAMVLKLLGELQITNIGWLRELQPQA